MDDKLKKYFSKMGKKGARKRFAGKSKKEISEIMREMQKKMIEKRG